jgi:hypothetical protein
MTSKENEMEAICTLIVSKGISCCNYQKISYRVSGISVDVGCSSCGNKLFELPADQLHLMAKK